MAFKVPKLPKSQVQLPKSAHIKGTSESSALKEASGMMKETTHHPSGRSRPMDAGAVPSFSAHPGHGSSSKTAEQVANELEAKTKGMQSQLASY